MKKKNILLIFWYNNDIYKNITNYDSLPRRPSKNLLLLRRPRKNVLLRRKLQQFDFKHKYAVAKLGVMSKSCGGNGNRLYFPTGRVVAPCGAGATTAVGVEQGQALTGAQ